MAVSSADERDRSARAVPIDIGAIRPDLDAACDRALARVAAPGSWWSGEERLAIAREVREGKSLSASMQACGFFPPVAVKMVEVGESTGALQDMLNAAADFFDEEIETTLGRFMTLIEPLLLVIMGIVIAGLLLALYWPLLQLGAIAS